MKKSITSFIIAGCTASLLLSGCAQKKEPAAGSSNTVTKPVSADVQTAEKENSSGISNFRYSYNNSFGSGSYSYEIDTSSGKPVFYYYSADYLGWTDNRDDFMKTDVEEGFIKELEQLYHDTGIAKWNGFDKTAEDVMDGSSFSLSMDFKDGEHFYAYGSNSYPDGYSEFRNKMDELFKPLVKKVSDEFIREKRNRKIEGELDSVLISINENGADGYNEYLLSLYEDSGNENNNLHITANERKSEILPEGYYNYYGHVEDVSAWMTRLRDIFDKHGIQQWNCFEEFTEGDEKGEWFEISFGFSDDYNVYACGTKHPENYKEFRADIMALLTDMIKAFEVTPES